MGLATIITAALKRISWSQVAEIALQYGPDVMKKVKERLQGRPAGEAGELVTVEQLHERVRELEAAFVRQEELIEVQNSKLALLEGICRTLQARLNICLAATTGALVLALVLLVMVLQG